MKNNKILKSKVKKNTILSVFDNIQNKPITLLQWIKKVYKNSRIERIEVQESNEEGNDFGFILVFYFLDGSTLSTPLIRVATQEVLEQIQQAINELNERVDTEINDRELADSELQLDIDNHTSNKSNPHETTFTNLLDKPSLLTSVEQHDNELWLFFYGIDTPFKYVPIFESGVAWGSITGTLANQSDLAELINTMTQDISTLQEDISTLQEDINNEVNRATSEEGRIEGLLANKQNKLYQHNYLLVGTNSSNNSKFCGTITLLLKRSEKLNSTELINYLNNTGAYIQISGNSILTVNNTTKVCPTSYIYYNKGDNTVNVTCIYFSTPTETYYELGIDINSLSITWRTVFEIDNFI